MMIISTSYFPNLQHLSLIAQGAQVECHENFQKQTLRNRCQIMTAQGVQRLSVPVIQTHEKMAIADVTIDYTLPWQRTHLRTIVAAYASAPYYDHFIGQVEPIFYEKYKYLIELNNATAELLFLLLKIQATLRFTDNFRGVEPLPEFVGEQYYQVFSESVPFAANLSGLDVLFCDPFLNFVDSQRGIISAPIIR